MKRLPIKSFCSAALFSLALPLTAQEAQSEIEEPVTGGTEDTQSDTSIIVDGSAQQDSGESVSERVQRVGRQITRRARSGKPIGRFAAPLCVKVSGLPDDYAAIMKARIEENASQLRGLKIDDDPDCSPNAFVGVLNNVNEAVEQLEKDEPWLFQGLLSYQMDRIRAGSEAVRAWHVFDVRNIDGSTLPGWRGRSPTRSDQIGELINAKESATRLIDEKVNLLGAVVLIEASALRDKTMRQLSDYATFRLLASVSDDVKSDPNTPETILTLFNEDFAPRAITDFDLAYLQALHELPANSRDGQVIAAAVSRYLKLSEKDAGS